ncbi:MAG: DNA replication and repair protein RecF [Candidatus Berkelbacteria bacterium Gr01-1014_85]|uniref:DNA replication and repair protein RecF n=1 Tax=Candidatus Berkelbacteria bacterium Gr01-1014_85 TaxID=2017150 RepID=A0A554JDY0_9BACT|nr:MAG: DNA replication and repair protein RecF [Candidatus Berkelbacteria bacterium Gr01-1014_85]
MLIELQLRDFRNHHQLRLELGQVTALIGPNGSGKTNILETIHYLALARSFRTHQDHEAINFLTDQASIKGQLSNVTELMVALVREGKVRKQVNINGVGRRPYQLIGQLAVVSFLPESLLMISGSPQLRRQWLDLLLIQIDPDYARSLVKLQKLLRQKNRLLKVLNQADEYSQVADSELETWNQQLAEVMAPIVVARLELLRSVQSRLTESYNQIAEGQEQLELRYLSGCLSQSEGARLAQADPSQQPTETEYWQQILSTRFTQSKSREIRAGLTLYGPQRDDWQILIGGQPFEQVGSRGETRSLILALKSIEAEVIATQVNPVSLVFLLDDVYSELDQSRRAALERIIGQHQAIITTTDLEHLAPELQRLASCYRVETDSKLNKLTIEKLKTENLGGTKTSPTEPPVESL